MTSFSNLGQESGVHDYMCCVDCRPRRVLQVAYVDSDHSCIARIRLRHFLQCIQLGCGDHSIIVIGKKLCNARSVRGRGGGRLKAKGQNAMTTA